MALIEHVTSSVVRIPLGYVNAYIIGTPQEWVLLDSGERTHARRVLAATKAFAGAQPPQAIVLTHGHFDHAGAANELAQQWNVPVYASRYELPFLQGEAAYPAPDTSVGGFYGWLARFVTMPACNMQAELRTLPADLAALGLGGWTCIATPGHTPGHIALFHAAEGVLLAGDACLTVNFQSWLGSLTKWPRVSAPPAPYTLDWEAARASVQALATLQPRTIASGHGVPIHGRRASRGLARIAQRFVVREHGGRPAHAGRWPTPRAGTTPCTR
jgi:glyoxylase-like metal-dependent hydrolase (beta-lactamase superfamily II)